MKISVNGTQVRVIHRPNGNMILQTPDMIEAEQPVVVTQPPAPVTFWGFLLGVFNTIVGLAVTIVGLAILALGAALCLTVGALATVVWLLMGLVGLVWSGFENLAFRAKHGMGPTAWRKQNRPRAREFRV